MKTNVKRYKFKFQFAKKYKNKAVGVMGKENAEKSQ